MLLGFIGAGGAGFIIAMLSEVFDVPIHTALGTSLAAMVFTSLSGTISHLRERNTMLKIGLATGLFGGIGAFFGSRLAVFIPESDLKWFTAGMLFYPQFCFGFVSQSASAVLLRKHLQRKIALQEADFG